VAKVIKKYGNSKPPKSPKGDLKTFSLERIKINLIQVEIQLSLRQLAEDLGVFSPPNLLYPNFCN